MTASVDFPVGLRAMIQSGQVRSVSPAFVQASPAIGPPYIESLTDDTPFEYTFSLVFTAFEASIFMAWFNAADKCNKGRAEFNFPVVLDGGAVANQVVRFTDDGVPQLTGVSGLSRTYSCKVIGRELIDPMDNEWVLAYFEKYGNDPTPARALDEMINIYWTGN